MFSKNTNLSNIMVEKIGRGDYVFSDAAILSGAYTSTESPFDCFIEMFGAAHISGDRWTGDEYGRLRLDKHHEVGIHVLMDTDEMLIVDTKVKGIDQASHLNYHEVNIANTPAGGTVNYLPAEQVYRFITSKSQGPAAMKQVLLRLNDIDPNNPAQQLEWAIEYIKVWKVTIN